jgi:uncharacterized protein YdeI (BOF family)
MRPSRRASRFSADRGTHGAVGREKAMDNVSSRRIRILAVVLVVGVGFAAASCHRILSTRIATIEKNLIKYDGKTITVYGKVKERIDLPTLKCYVLDDGTGTIGVVTRKALPRVGDTVHTKGRVNSSFKIGRRALIAVVEPEPPVQPRPKLPPPPGKLPS